MGIGIAPGLVRTGAPGPAPGWSPAALFAQGQSGIWYDPGSVSSMRRWGGGPVTQDGDEVALLSDLSGNGHHATQTGDIGFCPRYRTDGTRHWLEFDGVDDRLDIALPDRVADMHLFVGAEAAPGTGNYALLGQPSSNGRLLLALNGNRFIAYPGDDAYTIRIDGDVVSAPVARVGGEALSQALDGTFAVAEIEDAPTEEAGFANLRLGGMAGGYWFAGKVFGVTLSQPLDPAMAGAMRGWMRARA